jgi:hypothetical protein
VQSTKQSQQDTLKVQIEQLFNEVVSVWKDSDTKKIEAVKRLAARMEEYYLSAGWAINTISTEISRRLRAAGIEKTAHHVSDYLDEKYKLSYAPRYNLSNSLPTDPDNGMLSPNNRIEEIIKKDPLTAPKEEVQEIIEYAKNIEVNAKAFKQAADIRHIAYDTDGHIPGKHYEKVTTDLPEAQATTASQVWNSEVMSVIETFYNSHKEVGKNLERIPPDAEKAKAMVEPFREYVKLLKLIFEPVNEFIGPFKDLKFATTKPKWWKIVLKFFDHGKHAAAVMDAINSHKYLEERELRVLKIQCPACQYFATVPDNTKTPMDPQARSQVKLYIDHVMDYHNKEVRYSNIKIEEGKVTIQVPAERDLTREQVGDQIKELVELAIRFVSAIKAMQALSEWREQFVDGRVATRRMDAREKLSDLA